MAIVGFSRGFIFVKTTKTAGTSIEVHLARQCGPDDVVTPIFPEVEGHLARNHSGPDGSKIFYNHQPLSEIRNHIDPEFYASAFKFCFERHPVDKCISHYSMFKNSPLHAEMRSFANWDAYVDEGHFPMDHMRYMDADGGLLVDHVYPYEQLQDSLDDIARRCGFPPAPLTVREKTGWRETITPTPAQYARIMNAFSETNALMGYI